MELDRRGCVVQPRPWANRQREEPVGEAVGAMVAFGNNQFADLHRILGTHRSATLKFSSGIHCLQDLYQAAYSCCCSDNCILSSIICRRENV